MSKRGQNEGSIYKREDGRWTAVLNLGYVGGKRKRKSFYGNTRKEVKEQLTAAMLAQEQGLFVPTERQTVQTFLLSWLDDVVKQKNRLTTYYSYKEIVDYHLNPDLGHFQLAKLTPQEVQSLLNRKLESGLAPRMVQYIRAVLRIALGKALKWGLVPQNVARLVDTPRVPKYEPHFLDPEQSRRLLVVVQQHRLASLYTVVLALGLRKGEALGLRWEDVDFEKQQIIVRMNLQFIKGQFHMLETKSAKGYRVIALPDFALTSLREHQARQAVEREIAGEAWKEHGLVYPTSLGTPYHASNINRIFNRLLITAGLQHLRVHDLRHTCASLLIAQGVHARVIMEVLGHTQISLTMNTYGHIFPRLKSDAADKLQKLLGDET